MFGRCGRSAGSIFTTGPTMTSSSRAARRPARQQVEVHPLVDDAVEAEPRARGCAAWSAGSSRWPRARLGEVRRVDADGKGWTLRVPVALGFVQAVAAGEDDVGAGAESSRSRADQLGRRAPEGGQLVHAVVDDARPRGGARSQRHRRVVPEHRRRGSPRSASRPSSRSRCAPRAVCRLRPVGQHGARRPSRRSGAAGASSCGAVARAGRSAPPRRTPRVRAKRGHQVLRPLEHEIPAQVGQAEQQRPAVARVRSGTGARRGDRHAGTLGFSVTGRSDRSRAPDSGAGHLVQIKERSRLIERRSRTSGFLRRHNTNSLAGS